MTSESTTSARAAADFLDDLSAADAAAAQQLMARLTGNYKHGNERTSRQHPRQQR